MGFNLFTWYSGATFGTWLNTRRNGTEVGRDADGNIYYEDSKSGRRWVIFAVDNDTSRVNPEWHGWLHKSRQEPPSETTMPTKAWVKPWRVNPTGSEQAELPAGALAGSGQRAPAAADYRPWTPGQ